MDNIPSQLADWIELSWMSSVSGRISTRTIVATTHTPQIVSSSHVMRGTNMLITIDLWWRNTAMLCISAGTDLIKNEIFDHASVSYATVERGSGKTDGGNQSRR